MRKAESMRRVGSYTRRKKKLFEENNYTCQICGFSILELIMEWNSKERPKDKEELKLFYQERSRIFGLMQCHHIKPLSNNGSNLKGNLVVVCNKCHENIHKELEKQELKKREKIREKKGRKIKVIAKGNSKGYTLPKLK